MNKYTKIRIESWCKKLCQIINNINWKKTRNLYAIYLLDMIINDRYEEPFTKFAPEGNLPYLSRAITKSKLSQKFYKYLEKNMKPLSNDKKIIFQKDLLNYNINKNKGDMSPEEPRFIYINSSKKKDFNEINKCRDPDLLKKYIEKLQYKISETEKIINEQNKEKKALLIQIDKLKNLINSYKI